jgi:ribosomal protein S12 methylthiotransferase accessory factor YcaO
LGVTAPMHTVALQIQAGPGLSVIFAADFQADGGSFCFGAACRDAVDPALQGALLELCQARFSLALSRMKQQRFGPSGLVAGDRANLRMADRIGRADVLRLVGASPAASQIPRPTAALLGRYCGLLQVATARLDPDTPAPGQGVLGILCPYTGAT